MKRSTLGIYCSSLLGPAITWWASPIDHALNYGQPSPRFERVAPLVFGARGVAPLGYAAFAFALGVTAGVLIGRTVPAMAITLVIFASVQVVMPQLVRPHLIPPVQATAPFNADTADDLVINTSGNGPATMTLVGNFSKPGAWILHLAEPLAAGVSPLAPSGWPGTGAFRRLS